MSCRSPQLRRRGLINTHRTATGVVLFANNLPNIASALEDLAQIYWKGYSLNKVTNSLHQYDKLERGSDKF